MVARACISLSQAWYLKSEIFSIQWFLLLRWRGAGAGRQCWNIGKERREKSESWAELHPLCLLLSCLLTSLSAPSGQLRARLPLLVEIFFLCAAVSPRTRTNTHLKAVPSQQITTTQVRRGKQKAVRRVGSASLFSCKPGPTYSQPPPSYMDPKVQLQED